MGLPSLGHCELASPKGLGLDFGTVMEVTICLLCLGQSRFIPIVLGNYQQSPFTLQSIQFGQ